jgi:hypothetical protein
MNATGQNKPTGIDDTPSGINIEHRGESSVTGLVPTTAAFLVTLLGAQYVGVTMAEVQRAAHLHTGSAIVLQASGSMGLFDELLEFHQRLIASQRDLPDVAMRVFQQNPWDLYD